MAESNMRILTLDEVARILRCSKAHMSNLTNGKVLGVPALATVKCGKRKVVRHETLLAWIEARESEASRKQGTRDKDQPEEPQSEVH